MQIDNYILKVLGKREKNMKNTIIGSTGILMENIQSYKKRYADFENLENIPCDGLSLEPVEAQEVVAVS